MNKKLVVFLICVLLFTQGMPAGISAQASEIGYTEQVFTADDGLPTTSTLALAQTPDGFIWLGGYGGLTRYDGNEFKSCGGSRISNVSDLLVSKDGVLWIASTDCGLVRYENDIFTFYSDLDLDQEQIPEEVSYLAEAADGRIYMASELGLSYVDTDGEVFTYPDSVFMDDRITDMACGKQGEVLCLTQSGLVYACDEAISRIEIALGDDKLRCMDYDDQSNQFYFGTEQNMVLVYDSDYHEYERFKVEDIMSINDFGFKDDGKQIFICSDAGVSLLQDGKAEYQNLKVKNSVEEILIDRDGNMWFASSRQGVLLVTKGRFKDVNLLGKHEQFVTNAIVYEDGRLLIGHDAGFIILDETTYEKIEDERYTDQLDGKRIRALFIDRQDRLWACTTGEGLIVRLDRDGYDWATYSSKEYPVIKSDKFRCVTETSIGIVAGTDAGAYVITEEGVRELATGLDKRVLSLVEVNDCIYAGTDGNGVYVIKDGEIISHVTREQGLTSLRIMRMIPCSGGRGLWMATGNNLDYLLFETGQVYHAETMPAANVLDCLVMQDSTLWILAGNGIYQTTENAILKDENTRDYRHYNKKNGIPYDVTANSYSCTVDDHAYICGTDGIIWMDLDISTGLPDQYSMVIDSLTLDGEYTYIQGQDSVNISADIRRLEINAHVPTYTQENPTLFYYLEGFDEAPIYLASQKLGPIVYTNLPGGKYTFHFGVYDPDSSSLGQEITMDLDMQYQWYENRTVQLILVMLVLVIIVLLSWFSIKIQSQKEKRELREKYVENEQNMLMKLAYTDYLTELNNRHYLTQFEELKLEETDYPVNIISIDCNNLKMINDQFGHAKGDELLRTLANLLKQYFPGENCHILRLGGDEFMVITKGLSQEEAMSALTCTTADAAEKKIGNMPITFCFGIATCNDPESYHLKGLIQEADEQMIRNKQIYHSLADEDGKAQFVYEASTNKRVQRHIKNDVLRNILYEAFAEASEYVYIYCMDMNSGVTRWSRNCVEFFGLPAEYMTEGEIIWLSHVHPDDREVYMEDLMAVFHGEKARHDCQYRAQNRFGEYVWVECKGSVITGTNGRQVFAGMMTRLDNQSIYDPLTGLKTKDQFYDSIQEYHKCAVLMVSIDNFKDMINTYGYECGDKILVQIGKIMMQWNNEKQKVFRLNGAEFIFIIPNGSKADVKELFARINESAGFVVLDNGAKLKVGYTGGATDYVKGKETADSLVNRIEQTMEYTKENQRGSLRFFSDEILEDFRRRALIKKELRESIDKGFEGFELYYQPLMDRHGKKIVGCEALLRWKGETIKDSYPMEFIPILEENDAIIEVGSFVMREAMKQQKRWSEKYGRFVVSCNVSYQQFLVDGYVDRIDATARALGVDPSCMIIELTESCSVQAPEVLADIFERLRSCGFRIALDDFGTGYASLEMLKKLPADGIKIEHNFVRELEKDSNHVNLAIIRSIVNLCEELGLHVIIEGVENAGVESVIRHLNVGYLQGYYYSKPVNRRCFEALLEENRRM